MARRAANPSEFQSTTYAIEELVGAEPIARTALLNLNSQLESSGMSAIAEKEHKAHYVADRASKTLLKLADIETVPPLTEEQRQHIAENLGHWTMLKEQTAPVERVRRRATPTRGMNTSKPKR